MKSLRVGISAFESASDLSPSGDLDFFSTMAKKRDELSFIEVKCSIGAREDLGRPTTTAQQNKEAFMSYLASV